MTKVAARIVSCGQADALRRSFVLAVAPALCLDASSATQVCIQLGMDIDWQTAARSEGHISYACLKHATAR